MEWLRRAATRLVEATERAALEARRAARRLEAEGTLRPLEKRGAWGSGVDGCTVRLLTCPSHLLYAYRVVTVTPRGLLEHIEGATVVEATERLEDSTLRAEAEMLLWEARLASRAPEPVVLDGPVADPPVEGPLGDAARRLHLARARLLHGRVVVGFIKRPRWSSGILSASNEALHATLVMREYLRSVDAEFAALGFAVRREGVHSHYGGCTRYGYVMARWWRWAAAVEAPCWLDWWDAVSVVAASTPRGSPLPLPVALAHTEAGLLAESASSLASALLRSEPRLAGVCEPG